MPSAVMTATTTIDRRTVHYEELSDILDDARRLAAGPHHTVGNWTFPQILEHIARAIDMAFDGAAYKAPWPLKLFAPLVKNSIITRPMKPGFRLPKAATGVLPGPETPLDAALAHLDQSVGRFVTEDPDQKHPFFGRLTRGEYVQLHLRHAELHMSFVIADSPREDGSTTP